MKRIFIIVSLAIATLSIGCKKGSNVNPNKGIELNLDILQQQQAYHNNDFTFNLFRSVSATNSNGSNLFMSPLSVSMALGMTSNGANGGTLDSIRTVLGFGEYTQDQVNSYYNKLITELPELDPNTTLKIANSIWYTQNLNVAAPFLQTGNKSYLANIQSLDFSNPASLTTINNWVSGQTNGKITKVINKINNGDMMYLINAIYFKSIWASKFKTSDTQPRSFILPDNSEIETPFMNGHISCNYYRDADVSILELPYANDKYSLVMVMPPSGQSLNSFVSSLNSTVWKNWMGKIGSGTADVSMPKFQFTYSTSLRGELSAMGMGTAFSDAADFSNISTSAALKITDVQHKAYIAVDESGTEAAAVTTVIMGTTAPAPNIININRPFFFVIREMKSGLILFAGSVNNPAQTGL